MAVPELEGRALLLTVTALTSLGFMLIGYDNGLMGGLGESRGRNLTRQAMQSSRWRLTDVQ